MMSILYDGRMKTRRIMTHSLSSSGFLVTLSRHIRSVGGFCREEAVAADDEAQGFQLPSELQ